MRPSVSGRGLSALALKTIAVCAMVIDHGAALFPLSLPLFMTLHAIGRLTAPIMCFFLAEGYAYTRSLPRYLLRLGIFGLISAIPFNLFESVIHREIHFYSMGVIYTLFLALAAVAVLRWDKPPLDWDPLCRLRSHPALLWAIKLSLLLVLLFLARFGDWGIWAVLWVLCFSLLRDKPVAKWWVFAALCSCKILTQYLSNPQIWQLYQCGLFLSIPLLLTYRGRRGGKKGGKWFFYLFYPLHLLVLAGLAFLLHI